jgi:predicted nucleic-acid-binding protein
MRAVDTNILIRIVTRDDPKQVEAADAFIAQGAWVPQLVLVEAIWVLTTAYKLRPHELAGVVEMLLQHEHLAIQDADVMQAALRTYRERPSLGLSDCLVLEIARKAGHLPLGTFDVKLSKFDGAVLL